MSSSPEAGLANGDNSPSPSAESHSRIILDDRVSESDLSEVNETTALQSSPSPSTSPSSNRRDSPRPVDPESDESSDNDSDNDDNNASDDADFDMEESPAPSQSDGLQDQRSTSNDSRRIPKRKAVAEEDDYIRENPELYGLRRSVCSPMLYSCPI